MFSAKLTTIKTKVLSKIQKYLLISLFSSGDCYLYPKNLSFFKMNRQHYTTFFYKLKSMFATYK